MQVNLRALVSRFDEAMRAAMEGAAGQCVTRAHYEVEIEHFLARAVSIDNSDIALILDHYGIRRPHLLAELNTALGRLKIGNPRGPAFSAALIRMFSAAWSIATLDFSAQQIRTGHALLALLSEESLARLVRDNSQELRKISADALRNDLANIVADSIEASPVQPQEPAADSGGNPGAPSRTPCLDQYTVDLTSEAVAQRVDPVIGREREIRQLIDVLMRRRQNNPILTGEAGVGKTAVVEGLALRIAAGDVPPALRNVRLHSLDLALLQAGAGVKGEFENRIKGLVQEVKASPQPIILFIDEAHTMVGAGAQAGQGDAANILKPALARGELRTIAATTWSEYKQYFEKDAALARRFQVVKVEEPSEAQCETMLRGILPSLEKHHGVRILDEALSAAVRLSHRYLAGRQLPDKAVSVLDTACARVALSQSTTPAEMERIERAIAALQNQKSVLTREQRTGGQHEGRLAELDSALAGAEASLAELSLRWEQESALATEIRELRRRIEGEDPAETGARTTNLAQLTQLQSALHELQKSAPLAHLAVDSRIVGEILAEWTGIPLGRMLDDELARILNLERDLKRRIIGQDHALTAIAQRIQTSRANLDDPAKPVGVFLLAGPSGVGKTETALALADLIYGGEHNLISINMSEFQEAHSVSLLKGAPPGYVGYGQGGVLTEAVRRQPYSVVLLDEVEKAHPDVLELFFQVFDKGSMEDGEGRWIDFRNTLILLTTNAASDTIAKLAADPETMPRPTEMIAAIRPELNRIFKPAFLGRMLVVPYYPVRDEVLRQIIRLKLGRIQRRLRDNHRITLDYEESVVELVRKRCVEVESGARNVDHLLSNTVLPEISRELLARMAEEQTIEKILLASSPEGEFVYQWNSPAAAEQYVPA